MRDAGGPGAWPAPDEATSITAAMVGAFEQAATRDPSGASAEWYRLGGQLLRLSIAGEGLREAITPALAHLRVEASPEPALTVTLWDGAATGVPCPLPYLRDVFHRTSPFGRSVVASARDDSVIGYQSHSVITIYDRAARRIVGWADAAERLGLFERGKPLQPLLFAWQLDHGIAPIHAGLVGQGGRGVLLGGAGGSGKTTTSLVCLAAGFEYLGDDYTGLPAMVAAPPRGFSYYLSSWLEPEHARRFPWLLAHARPGRAGEDKLLVPVSAVPGARFPQSTEIAAIVLPRVTGQRETAYRRATMGEAVLRLAPSSILQLPFVRGRLSLERMTELAGRVPSYWLDLGTDLETIPRCVAQVLAEATADRPGADGAQMGKAGGEALR